jgi:hypothetical protein
LQAALPSDAVITIHSDKPETKSGTSERTGKDYSIREQDATLETPFMKVPCRIGLGKNQDAYPAGRYRFDVIRSLKVSDFGSIQFARDLKLVPVA